MTESKIFIILLMLVTAFSNSFSQSVNEEKESIIKTIEVAFIGGAFNDKDNKAMSSGFHETFVIHHIHEGEVNITTLRDWMDEIARWKSGRAEADEHVKDWSQIAEGKTNVIALKGNSAIAEVEITINDERSFRVFLMLYKFKDGWKALSQLPIHDDE